MKKTIILSVGILTITALSLSSCKIEKIHSYNVDNSINRVEKAIQTSDFSGIEVNGTADIIFTQGPASVKYSAPENMMPLIDVTNVNGTLVIKFPKDKSTRIRGNAEVKVICSSPSLSRVQLNGSGDFETKGGTYDKLDIAVNGSGDIDCKNCVINEFSIDINGSGDLEINGLKGKTASLNISGAGDADMENIDIEKLDIDVSGAGDVKLTGKAKTTVIEINGAGCIDVRGFDCNDMRTNRNGIGSIKR